MDLKRSTALEVKLLALNDGDAIRERTVRLSADGPLTIGRASSNRGVTASSDNTKIENKVISKEHALIRTDSAGENVFLKDLKSMHGTKVDGLEVPRGGEVRVVSGAELQFGVSVVRGSETYKPAMYQMNYQFWDSRTRSSSPYEYEPAMDDKVEFKRGYTDGVSSYSDDEDDACAIVHDTYENLIDGGDDNGADNDEPSSLFGEISENSEEDSYSEGEPEAEVDYPEESEEDDDSDSDSGESTQYEPGMPRSTTPPGGPVETDFENEIVVIKAPEILKRFQNSISDLVDQPPTVPEVLERSPDHKHDEPIENAEYPHDESVVQSTAEAAQVTWSDIPTVRPEQENFVEAHQKVDDLIADALAEVKKARESTSLEPNRPRPQKRTADQAELDSMDTPNENDVKTTKDTKEDGTKVHSWPAERPRKRTTGQFLRSFARDTTIFAAGSLAMLVGLANLPNSLAP
ncbi:hypothetical protein IWZ00DRAFT_59704 [Phyllosticta capitalensis]|uniref:uncharacterized protein n=1 Tax=Phyllosticta capitalensis TaxID=121624 RepID=UPI00312EEAEA